MSEAYGMRRPESIVILLQCSSLEGCVCSCDSRFTLDSHTLIDNNQWQLANCIAFN